MKQLHWGKTYNQTLSDRPPVIFNLLKDYIKPTDSILEIGAGAGMNLKYLLKNGFNNLTALDVNRFQLLLINEDEIKMINQSIQDYSLLGEKYDVIFSSSVLYFIPDEDASVFERIAKMANKYLITIEGEADYFPHIFGRDYNKIFSQFGFRQIEHKDNIFNSAGHFRVFEKYGTDN
jgi:2-polyprenyl-3-methyl-5-hydroxy-6-metoxy-1,4-benzoquinol methylase